MKRIIQLTLMLFVSIPAMLWAAQKNDLYNSELNAKHAIANYLVTKLEDPLSRQKLLAIVTENPSISFKNLAHDLDGSLVSMGGYIPQALTDNGLVPEIRLYTPANISLQDGDENTLVVYVPEGNEKSWDKIKAYDKDGNIVYLNADKAPDQKVIIIDTRGSQSTKNRIDKANEMLREAGLQPNAKSRLSRTLADQSYLDTTKLTQVSVKDDKEPWIKGAAEIYAIVNGVTDDNQPVIKIVDMPYLDYDHTEYYPNQILVFWSDYTYRAVDVLFYESDGDTNYKALVEALIEAAGTASDYAGYLAGKVIAEISSKIIDAMPDSWFTDDDDYVDSIYTLEEGVDKTLHGAASNITATFAPYKLKEE
ncbi:MAG: DUF3103 family protein [Francisellaceae bacterium]